MQHKPCLQVGDCFFHSFLVVFDHVVVHARVITANVLLCAAIRDRSKLQGWVLFSRVLKLREGKRKIQHEGVQEMMKLMSSD